MSAPKWSVGMRQLGPGVYLDKDNAIHADGVTICHAHGVPATPENQDMVERAVRRAAERAFPTMEITVVEPPE